MLRKLRFILFILALLIVPAFAEACDFQWSINGVTFTCSQTTHEYVYTYSYSGTTINGNQVYYHTKGIKHVSSRIIASMPDASVWIEDLSTEQCTAITVPAVPGSCLQTGLSSGSKCKFCNHVIVEQTETPKKGHTIVNDPAIPATCTETGKTAGTHCSVCNTVINAQTEVPAKGHNWLFDTIVAEPTALQSGIAMYTCTRCNQIKEDELPSLTNASGYFGDGFSWHLEIPDTTEDECILVVSGNGAMPSWYDTTRPWQPYLDSITKIVIQDGITSISSSTFYQLPNTVDFVIGNSVQSIENSAFYYCNLGNMTIPNNVTEINNTIFPMCDTTNLQIFLYSNGYPYQYFVNHGFIAKCHFLNCGSSESISWILSEDGTLTFTGEGVLSGDLASQAEKEKVKTIIIGEGITGFSGTPFYSGYSNLVAIYLPESLTNIGSAFLNGGCFYCNYPLNSELCAILSSRGVIVSPRYPSFRVKQIRNEDSTLGISIERIIGSDDTIIIPSIMDGIPVTSIKSSLNNHSLVSLVIEAEVVSLPVGVFQNCSSLVDIVLPLTLVTIPDNAFYECTSLVNIDIPASVTSIGKSAFESCSSLTAITIPYNVTYIPSYAFRHCTSLSNITIPASVVSVGAYAFYDCPLLQVIAFSGEEISIGEYAFYNCTGLSNIKMPTVSSGIGQYAFYNCSELTEIIIPNGIERISGNTFQKCTGLSSISVPNSVYAISPYAFADCTNLNIIYLPDNLTLFDSSVFSNCTALIKVFYKPNSQTAMLLKQYGFFTTYVGCILSGQIRKGSNYYDITELINRPITGNSAGRLLVWTENDQLVAVSPGYEKRSASINGNTTYTLYITVLDTSGELIMPDDLIAIENEAFSSVPAQKIVISDNCESIGSGAFSNGQCVLAVIPGSVVSIAEDAFPDTLITVKTNSYSSPVTEWCDQKGILWYVE